MQQLLSDELGTTTPFSWNYFYVFRMVLVSADDSMDFHRLADMADKMMESDNRPDRTDASEIEQLREEVACLADLVSSLTT